MTFQAWPRCSAVLRRMLLIGLRSTSPHFVKSGSGATARAAPPPLAAGRQRRSHEGLNVLRADAAVRTGAVTRRMSTPSSRARRRTDGAAAAAGPRGRPVSGAAGGGAGAARAPRLMSTTSPRFGFWRGLIELLLRAGPFVAARPSARKRGPRGPGRAATKGPARRDRTNSRGRSRAAKSSNQPRRARRGSRPRRAEPTTAARRGRRLPPAAPSVRRLARELGVDIRRRHRQRPGRPDQRGGRAGVRPRGADRGGGGGAAAPRRPLPDFTKWGEVERKPMSNIRRKTAEHLVARVERDPARHAARQGRHHRARGAAQALRAAGRAGRRQADDDGDRAEDRRRRAAASSRSSTRRSTWRATRSSTRSRFTSASPSTPRAACSCRSSATSTARASSSCRRSWRKASEKARAGKLVARRDAGRRLHDHQPRRHRRHVVHADRQLARGRDPRRLARRAGAGLATAQRRSSRG